MVKGYIFIVNTLSYKYLLNITLHIILIENLKIWKKKVVYRDSKGLPPDIETEMEIRESSILFLITYHPRTWSS